MSILRLAGRVFTLILVRSFSSWETHTYLTTNTISQGFTRRIVGVPKAESDAILTFLFRQISDNPDHQVRFRWEVNSIALWDNRVRTYLFLQLFKKKKRR